MPAAVMADRAENQLADAPVTATTHDELLRLSRLDHEHMTGITLADETFERDALDLVGDRSECLLQARYGVFLKTRRELAHRGDPRTVGQRGNMPYGDRADDRVGCACYTKCIPKSDDRVIRPIDADHDPVHIPSLAPIPSKPIRERSESAWAQSP